MCQPFDSLFEWECVNLGYFSFEKPMSTQSIKCKTDFYRMRKKKSIQWNNENERKTHTNYTEEKQKKWKQKPIETDIRNET